MEEESIQILKFFGLITNIEEYQKNIIMPEENINQEISLKNIDEIRNYLIEKINWHELISKEHEKVCIVFNYIHCLLFVTFSVTGCVSISAFASLVGIPIGNTIFAIGLKQLQELRRISQ